MTYVEFLNAVIASEGISEELKTYATDAVEKHLTANEKKREKAAEKRVEKEAEKAPIREALLAVLGSEPKTASELVELIAPNFEIKFQAIPSLLKPFIEEGKVEKLDVKGKKGPQKGYKLA